MPDHKRGLRPGALGNKSSAGVSPQVIGLSPSKRQTVWWVMTVVLAVIATVMVMRPDYDLLSRSALGQSAGVGSLPQAGARGIFAFTGQLTSKSYGLFMMDVDTGTIWCYEMQKNRDGELQMRLVAARSWIFDRFLEEFNVADPTPGAVRAMVEQQRGHRQEPQEAGENAVGPNAPALPGSGKGSN